MKKSFLFPVIICFLLSCSENVKTIKKPERIRSKREIVYSKDTYLTLAEKWKAYYEYNPSSDSYANWIYAARYAESSNYKQLLEDGAVRYPYNPTLLYLKALLTHGKKNNSESIALLEQAIELDSSFVDPWFVLAVDYSANNEIEKSNTALKKLLTAGIIEEVVMDYNYNVISLLEKDAVLITNGDNDTYPSWILTKILKFRPDVKIVNRSLLNTDWYPIHLVINEGFPNFITKEELTSLRENIFKDIQNEKIKMPAMGPYSDTLLTSIITFLLKHRRPIYLASTLFSTNAIKIFKESGINLGLVVKIKSERDDYRALIKNTVSTWLSKFRTSGLLSWELRYSNSLTSAKQLTNNYAGALHLLMEPVRKILPERRLDLFNWYLDNISEVIQTDKVKYYNAMWCMFSDIKEINIWCENHKY